MPLFHGIQRTAFAAPAGGGFGGGGGSVKKSKKKAKTKKSKSLLSEVEVVKTSPKKSNLDTPDNTQAGEPKLDKWGLPVPTTDDIFPPMPPGTELISVDNTKEEVTLSDISNALKNHIELSKLTERFDEQGVEKGDPKGRPPMKLGLLHRSPPVLTVENFFTKEECEQVQNVALASDENGPVQVQSATFSALAQSKRTSTSWFCYYSQVPTLLAKARHVLGIPTLEQMEEPQIVRYKVGEEFSWHYDEVPGPQLKNGGQRLATLLVYLNDVAQGGGTVFRDLQDGSTGEMLTMRPKLGSALLFFPAFGDGTPDDRTLHKGEVAGDEKWIIQMWIHERGYVASLPESNYQESAQQSVNDVAASLGYR
ncbi:Probable prolyl 4-hydroxylase [Seminavis robusta]|uniref:Probable prolyl 4-hydroxylase n=1 Tax=Seminavis robusta TaxID=568900 RepID=A0A9N8EJ44_9STRA|nr:Probable prolyl 4-hydroxylase [Seminavis robusta]|eukprot:Sro1070_g237700.1 Probable prolyl 4-hydroxylase (366) ;mRNA; r:1206-2303